jgi:hypothetical protein
MATTFTGTGFISNFKPGDVKPDGTVEVEFEITPTGKVTMGVTYSTGLTTPFFSIVSNVGGDTVTPAAAGSTYTYNVRLGAGAATYTVTPTAAAGTIVLTDATGATQTIVTGNASSALAAPTNGMHTIYISVTETNKASRKYTLHVGEPV